MRLCGFESISCHGPCRNALWNDRGWASSDGKTLYYNGVGGSNNTISPLMAKSLTDGAERRILDQVYARRFVPVKEGIYYLGPVLADGKIYITSEDGITSVFKAGFDALKRALAKA